jgi:hypothetical protein
MEGGDLALHLAHVANRLLPALDVGRDVGGDRGEPLPEELDRQLVHRHGLHRLARVT